MTVRQGVALRTRRASRPRRRRRAERLRRGGTRRDARYLGECAPRQFARTARHATSGPTASRPWSSRGPTAARPLLPGDGAAAALAAHHLRPDGSAFASLEPASVDWERVLAPDTCLLVTGITPPLRRRPTPRRGGGARDRRGEIGATVALDVNYRAALWSVRRRRPGLASVLPRIDVLSAGVDDLVAVGVEGRDRSPTPSNDSRCRRP